ncbi:transposase [Candidatus Enterovibrio escicola]|nr:transposase [Candidatus Enterovibrio escacola]
MLLLHAPSWITFIDSSKLLVCHNLRILRHQVFKGV